jgi:hypothetical protein
MKVHKQVVLMLTLVLAAIGCSDYSAQVRGRVTCENKPVVGSILFSPRGEDPSNTGPAVSAALNEDGAYELKLKSIGKHTVVITPRDIKFPVPPGQFDYPCDRSPLERDIQAGATEVNIDMAARRP